MILTLTLTVMNPPEANPETPTPTLTPTNPNLTLPRSSVQFLLLSKIREGFGISDAELTTFLDALQGRERASAPTPTAAPRAAASPPPPLTRHRCARRIGRASTLGTR